MTILAGGGSRLFHCMAGPAHPVGNILAEAGNVTRSDIFPVTLLAITFIVALVCPVRKSDAISKLENTPAFISKSGYRQKKSYEG